MFKQKKKTLVNFPGWPEPEHAGTGFSWFHSPLVVGGFVEQGFVLKGSCYLDDPDRNVSFELRISDPYSRKTQALYRAEWRSRRGGHSHKKARHLALAAVKRVGATHYHPFAENWVESEGRMREGNLPVAFDFEQDIQSFEEFRDIVGNMFKIRNIALVSRPNWVLDLFRNA